MGGGIAVDRVLPDDLDVAVRLADHGDELIRRGGQPDAAHQPMIRSREADPCVSAEAESLGGHARLDEQPLPVGDQPERRRRLPGPGHGQRAPPTEHRCVEGALLADPDAARRTVTRHRCAVASAGGSHIGQQLPPVVQAFGRPRPVVSVGQHVRR
ncbi:MAG: hypothetical protein ACRD2C_18395 [Acidimicrobiales bacterium]